MGSPGTPLHLLPLGKTLGDDVIHRRFDEARADSVSLVIALAVVGDTSRCRKAVKANDHDMGFKDKLAPFGILNMMTGLLTVIFGVSFETSDFIVDCLRCETGVE